MNDDMHSHKSLRKRFLSCTWMGSWGWAFVSLSSASGLAQHPVGEWTSHVPYDRVREVMLAGDNVVARTDFALFTVDTSTYEVVRYTKGSGLSEVNPTALAYDELRQQWITR